MVRRSLGSTVRTVTPMSVRPVGLQVAPPSVLLRTPLGRWVYQGAKSYVPAYNVFASSGSTVRTLTTGNPKYVHVAAPFELLISGDHVSPMTSSKFAI